MANIFLQTNCLKVVHVGNKNVDYDLEWLPSHRTNYNKVIKENAVSGLLSSLI